MRLFGYYAFHSFLNQIRKLLKTWVLIFIVIFILILGGVGFIAGSLSSDYEESTEETDEYTDEESSFLNADENDMLHISLPGQEEVIMEPAAFVEAAAFLIGLFLLFFFLFTAEGGVGKLFLMADVNLLFSSPMKPQSILLFRLMTKLGLILLMCIYFGFCYMPMLLSSGMLTPVGILVIFLAIFVIIGYSQLLQVLEYTLAHTYPSVPKKIRPCLYGIIVLILLAFSAYWKSGQMSLTGALAAFLTSPALRLVPIVGWAKGLAYGGVSLSLSDILLYLGLSLGGMVLLFELVWRIKADFYEEAMAKSEETAAKLLAAKEKGSLFTVSRKKEKKGKPAKTYGEDGFYRGSGANVFFFKAMHIRYRFARFHYFTKTCGTYLAAVLITGLFCRFVLEADCFYPAMLLLAVMVFYRSMGNPVEEDTRMDLFRMIPESAFRKIFFSILGCSVNTLLDLLPAVMLITLLSGESMILALLWTILLVSVNLYATSVGTFIQLSLPDQAGTTLKQMVQVMFVYFGLLPDVGLVALAFVLDLKALFFGLAMIFNLFVSCLFHLLTGRMLEPGRAISGNAKKTFSRLGLAALVMLIVTYIAQFAAAFIASRCFGDVLDLSTDGIAVWLLSFLPMYLIGYPAGYLVLKKIKPEKIGAADQESFTVPEMLGIFAIITFIGYSANFLVTIISSLAGVSADLSSIESLLTSDQNLFKFLVIAFAAPCMEELFFRRWLIDRMRPYGEKLAIVTTAVMFGLFHGNLTQFFYATAVGLVLGYVYVRTGKMRYNVSLHMAINFMSTCASTFILPLYLKNLENFGLPESSADSINLNQIMDILARDGLGAVNGILAMMGYYVVLFALMILGLILLVFNHKRIHFKAAEREVEQSHAFQTAGFNGGMIAFAAVNIILIAINLMASI